MTVRVFPDHEDERRKQPRPVIFGENHGDASDLPRSPARKKAKKTELRNGGVVPDSEAEYESDMRLNDAEGSDREHVEEKPKSSALEAALPSVKIDDEAIEEYEASQSQRFEEKQESGAADRLNSRKWVRGKSSIYVDAFDLALDTVLDEESDLFNETELALFKHWRDLSYEAKFL
jgi:Fanconi-associated nuclease 1